MTSNHNRNPGTPLDLDWVMGAHRETVVAKKAHLGIAFDGDADRVGAVDETGRILG